MEDYAEHCVRLFTSFAQLHFSGCVCVCGGGGGLNGFPFLGITSRENLKYRTSQSILKAVRSGH